MCSSIAVSVGGHPFVITFYDPIPIQRYFLIVIVIIMK